MKGDCILAIDQGTTTSRAVVLSAAGAIVAHNKCEFPQHYPRPGWVEHDLEEVWQSVLSAVTGAIQALGGDWSRIAAIGIANQRETVGLWERETGRPLGRAIVWQCRRTAEECERLRDEHEPLIRERTGLTADPYFSGTKLAWLLDSIEGARGRAGELAAGTIDTWLVWRLTGGRHVTDPTNASRTMLYDIGRQAWSEELCELIGVPQGVLPEVLASGAQFGATAGCDGIPAGVPIRAIIGDQQAALFGQGCVEAGQAKNTYGTGCFLLTCTGAQRVGSASGLLTTMACDRAGNPCYALEGSVFIAGAAVQWLRDELGVIAHADEIEALAGSVADTAGVSFVPAFVGLGAPYWDPHARGAVLGLTRGAGKAHLARATLEAIAHQSADVIEVMRAEGAPVAEVRVDGGASRNSLLMQMQADFSGVAVLRPAEPEMTALGAGYLAGIGAGIWENPWALAHESATRFEPVMSAQDRQARREGWKSAVRKVRAG